MRGILAVLSMRLLLKCILFSLLFLDLRCHQAFGFIRCKNLFAKEHNNVAEIYQNSSPGAGRLSGDGLSAQADIVIGVAGPFTGPNATYGDQYWHGATQAAEDINAAGGINGEKIKLVQGDDACEPKQAVAVANRLVDQDKVKAVVGHFCSSSTMPASEVYSDAGILSITPGSTNPLITERGMSDIFRMCGRDDQQGQSPAILFLIS